MWVRELLHRPRKLLLMQGKAHWWPWRLEDAEVEEEAFNFDPGVEEAELERRWYAMARYYSGQRSKGLFDEMGVAWRLEKPIPVRPLDGNRFILEFAEEEVYKFVLD